MKRLGIGKSALTWVALLLCVILGGREALAQTFYRGEITSFAPSEYRMGTTGTGKLKIKNTGVAGYFAAEAIEVPIGWAVSPTKTGGVIVGSDKSTNFEFQITAPSSVDYTGAPIKFRLYAYQDDQFEIVADEEIFTIKSVTSPGPFDIYWPSHAAVDVDQPITFMWNNSAFAQSYRFELYEDEFGLPKAAPFFTKSGLTSPNFTLTKADADLPQGWYLHWKVVAINNAGSTVNQNGPFLFRTRLAAPIGSFSFVVPAQDDMMLSTRPSFSWTAAENVTLYNLEVFRDLDGFVAPPAVRSVELFTTSYTWTGDSLTPGKYHVLVSAFNPNNNKQVEGGTRPFTASGLPAFSLTSPAAGVTDLGERPAFSWGHSTGATSYRFQLSLVTTGGLQPVIDTTISGAVSYQYAGAPLVRGGEYEWQVTALGGGEERTSANGPRRFTVRHIRSFSVLKPVAGDDKLSQHPLFKWQPAEKATSYRVQIAPSNNGVADTANMIVSPELAKEVTETILWWGDLQSNRDYFFRVAAKDGAAIEYNREGWVPIRTTDIAAFVLLTPLNGAQEVSLQTQLTWQPVASAQTYRIYLTPVETGAVYTFEVAGTQTTLSLGDAKLNGLTTYKWLAEALTATESRLADQVFSFTTSTKVTAGRSDVLDAILGRQVLSAAERQAAGIGADENIDVSSLMPAPN